MVDDEKKEDSEKKENKDDESVNWTGLIIIGVLILVAIGAVYFYNSGGDLGGIADITGNTIFGGGDSDGGDITIGFMGPLSGEAASYGNGIKNGVDLALKDSGLSERVEIVYEDSQCEGRESVNAITKLIDIDKAVAIIGEVCSGATIPAAPIAEENSVVLISAASTSPEITDLGDYIFRTVPSDALQGDFAANLIFDRGYRRLAILFSQEDYGVGLSTELTENFESLGGSVVASEAFERGSTDLRTQITKIKDSNADALYFISNSPDAAVAGLRQIRELGLASTLFASEGLKSPDILEAGDAAEGLTVTSVSVGTEEFDANYRAEYGEGPGPFAAQGYDAFTALANAIEQGASTGEEIRDALKDMKFEGASGFIDFDSNGDVFGNYDITIVNRGEFKELN